VLRADRACLYWTGGRGRVGGHAARNRERQDRDEADVQRSLRRLQPSG
jgi:hypothetical protein